MQNMQSNCRITIAKAIRLHLRYTNERENVTEKQIY